MNWFFHVADNISDWQLELLEYIYCFSILWKNKLGMLPKSNTGYLRVKCGGFIICSITIFFFLMFGKKFTLFSESLWYIILLIVSVKTTYNFVWLCCIVYLCVWIFFIINHLQNFLTKFFYLCWNILA